MTTLDQDAEDAAVVLTIVAALASAQLPHGAETPAAPSVWGDPAHRLGVDHGSSAWWASGLPR